MIRRLLILLLAIPLGLYLGASQAAECAGLQRQHPMPGVLLVLELQAVREGRENVRGLRTAASGQLAAEGSGRWAGAGGAAEKFVRPVKSSWGDHVEKFPEQSFGQL